MKSAYENEIMSFFTQEESFKTMLQVASHVNSVTRYVVLNFWDSLKEKLNQKYSGSGQEWNVAYSGGFDNGVCKLWVYKSNWCQGRVQPIAAFSFEGLHRGKTPLLGIFINHTYKGDYRTHEIKNAISNLSIARAYSVQGWDWYTCWKYMEDDMKDENLVKLLPNLQSRKDIIENYYNQLEQMVEIFELKIDEIVNDEKYRIK